MFLEDITQEEEIRLQIENNKKAMQEKEANLRALINNTKDTIFAIDKEYRITVVNDVLIAKYAKSGIELKEGLNILQLLPADLADYWKKQYDRALSGEQFSYLQENKNGQSSGFIEVYLNPIRNDKNEVIGVSVLSRDITEHLKHFKGDKKSATPSGTRALADKMSQLDNLDKVTDFIKQQINQNEGLLETISQLENGHHSNGNGKKNGHLK
jgi:PAS domain S-box-containing protein